MNFDAHIEFFGTVLHAQVGWLVGFLGWLVGWVGGWLGGWLVGSFVHSFVHVSGSSDWYVFV